MKRLLMTGVVASLLVWSSAPSAQTPPADTKTKPMADQAKPAGDQMKSKMDTVTMSGCLAKGADANSFTLNNAMAVGAGKDMAKDKPGAMAEKKSVHVMAGEGVKLDAHVGHQVELTGHMGAMAKGAKPMAGEGGKPMAGEGGKPAMQHFTVTAMKHVAPTCSQ